MLKPLMRGGKLVRDLPSPTEVREKVIKRLKELAGVEEFQPEPKFLVP